MTDHSGARKPVAIVPAAGGISREDAIALVNVIRSRAGVEPLSEEEIAATDARIAAKEARVAAKNAQQRSRDAER